MSWRDRAACFGMDINIFFPERGDMATLQLALDTCAACPVIDDCRAELIGEREGVFGGLSANARYAYRSEVGYKQRRPVAECGTDAGHRRHLRDGEPSCWACLDAHRVRNAEYEARRPRRVR